VKEFHPMKHSHYSYQILNFAMNFMCTNLSKITHILPIPSMVLYI
jgi:uncharacterized membrane protein